MEPFKLYADIHVPLEARIIAEVLKNTDPMTEVYVVGGAVRDYLFHKFHTDQSKPYKIKDLDLTTNLSETDILYQLQSEEAKRFCIKVKEKESVDTFGVVFASVGGKGPFEIAPFRKDIGGSDGRRPDHIERGTIYEDAMRRDLTINNLYYDFDTGVILDFNPDGQGIEDIKNRKVRTVGDPFARFEEDKLRILRLIRFFSRYNEGLIIENLDERTIAAIAAFKDLMSFKGMSAERIQTEFMLGQSQCLHTATYLKNYLDLNLFDSVFGKAHIDLNAIKKINELRNPRVVLAMLLHDNEHVEDILNNLKYPNEISDPVAFLCKAMTFNPENAVGILKARDKRIIKIGKKKKSLEKEEIEYNQRVKEETFQDMIDLSSLIENTWRATVLQFTAGWKINVPSGKHFIECGYQGEEIGIQQRAWLQSQYYDSLSWHLKTRNLPLRLLQ